VELEVGVQGAPAHRLLALVADALQLTAERHAVVVAEAENPVDVVDAGKGARGHHGGRKARALLVGPADDLERTPGVDAVVIERAHHLEPGQHADDPIVLAARHLGVEVAADEHGRQMILPPGAPGEDAAQPIHRHRAARFRAPGDEEVAHLLVGIGEREAPEAAGLAGPDPSRPLDGAPEALPVDPQRAVSRGHRSLAGRGSSLRPGIRRAPGEARR
jgi:hypothetical protein